ncbi:MAG: PDZ domain-containing protein [Ardenticatenaceae bacterium]|nr:PDZ domain-containing protein [Ardenticatenaceae bacterium]
MSDGQKQAVTVALITILALLLCGGGVIGAIFLFGGVADVVETPLPTIDPRDGVLIQTVLPGSPAAEANLQPGHILLRLNDEPITSPELLTLLLQNMPAGESYTLLVRDTAGEIRQTTAVRPAEPPYLGVDIIDLPRTTPNPTTANPTVTSSPEINLPVVTGVVPGSPAAGIDVQVGDVVTAVDGQAILNGAELRSQMANKLPGATITLTLRRGEETLVKTAVLAPHPDDPQRGYLGIEFQP